MSRAFQALVGVGANLGDRAATLRAAVERLHEAKGVLQVEPSAVYETEPIGVTDQPPFLNQVVGVETTLSPEELLARLQQIEAAFGRERTVRWGPRTLDLDLLAYEGETRTTQELTLPHPGLFEREFVTVPLREVLETERFRGSAWDALREKLGPSGLHSAAVRRFPRENR
jgi:2-amino-4-hydroxy-6-hydroxymethyldihydropteridine diphosphokinase